MSRKQRHIYIFQEINEQDDAKPTIFIFEGKKKIKEWAKNKLGMGDAKVRLPNTLSGIIGKLNEHSFNLTLIPAQAASSKLKKEEAIAVTVD